MLTLVAIPPGSPISFFFACFSAVRNLLFFFVSLVTVRYFWFHRLDVFFFCNSRFLARLHFVHIFWHFFYIDHSLSLLCLIKAEGRKFALVCFIYGNTHIPLLYLIWEKRMRCVCMIITSVTCYVGLVGFEVICSKAKKKNCYIGVTRPTRGKIRPDPTVFF